MEKMTYHPCIDCQLALQAHNPILAETWLDLCRGTSFDNPFTAIRTHSFLFENDLLVLENNGYVISTERPGAIYIVRIKGFRNNSCLICVGKHLT